MTKYTAKPTDARGFVNYTPTEDRTWGTLFNRQMTIMPDYACAEHVKGIQTLALKPDAVGQIPDISKRLMAATGWKTAAVAALISQEEFFTLLSKRTFPVATFIRIPEELDYLPEPDIFHEIFGHCPLLTHPLIADFMEAYGHYALKSSPEEIERLGRLFWFTIEFGLIQSAKGLRIYGGGILSSYQETLYALDDPFPKRMDFDLIDVLRTPFRIDKIQGIYFVLQSFQQLFALLQGDTLAKALDEALRLPDHPLRYKGETDGEAGTTSHPC